MTWAHYIEIYRKIKSVNLGKPKYVNYLQYKNNRVYENCEIDKEVMSLIESGSHTAISHFYHMYENLILVWRLMCIYEMWNLYDT